MQSVNTRRLSPTPQATVIAIAIGLAVLGGTVALEVTDTFPGREDSVSEAVSAPVVISESAGEGLVSPRHTEAILGAGATLDSVNPTIKGEPSFGQGEGLVGAGALTDLAAAPALTFEQILLLEQNGVFATETAPTMDQYIAGPHNEGYTDESSPAGTEYVADPHQGGPTEH